MPQFDASFFIGQIFWMMISFGFLYLMMSSLICPMIEEVFELREKQIQDDLNIAEKLNRQADVLHQRHQTYLLGVEQEKNNRIQKAYMQMQKEMATKENKHEVQLRRKVQKAEQKIDSAARQLKQKSEVLSDQLSDHLIAKLLAPKEDA